MSPEMLTLLMFLGVLVGIILGFPIAFTLIGLSFLFGYYGIGERVFHLFAHRTYGVMTEYIFAALPLFIFMGCMLERSGIAEASYDYLYKRFGSIRGGLAIATVLICILFAACTGIVGAAVATMGLVALPSMVNRNYNKSLATGVVGAGGTLGILIPPSIMLVLYGPMGGVSIVRLFAAAIIPGFLLAALYILYIVILCKFRPEVAPAITLDKLERPSLILGLKTFGPFIFLILAVLGAIFFGIAAPTEAAGMGAFGSIIVSAFNRKLTFKNLFESALTTLRISAMILWVAIGATLFTTVFYRIGGDDVIRSFLRDLGLSGFSMLAVVLLLVFLLGMFIDWVGILLIMTPIFAPILLLEGFDPLWSGMLIIIILQSSFLTPPFAYTLFYIKGVAPKGVELSHIYRGAVPFILLQVTALVLCILFPRIITWLPSLLH